MSATTMIFAHRGASAVAPENTLPAFEKALELGADGFELDVQATADGKLVVLHDYRLERSTNGVGLLRDHTLAQLAGIDAGIRFSESFANTPIPTLEQVFDLVGDSCIVNVEIKNVDWDGGPEAAPLARMIKQRNLYQQVIVSSFNPLSLRKMRQLDPSIRLGYLYFKKPPHTDRANENIIQRFRNVPPKFLFFHFSRPWFTNAIAPEALHPYFTSIDEQLMETARTRGQLVNAWTVNDGDEARRLVGLGVDGIITDVPDKIRRELSNSTSSSEPANL